MKIPKGWRKLRKGTIICEGDKFLFDFPKNQWLSTMAIGEKVGGGIVAMETYIRRIKKGTK